MTVDTLICVITLVGDDVGEGVGIAVGIDVIKAGTVPNTNETTRTARLK
jgi:hypothetical protein